MRKSSIVVLLLLAVLCVSCSKTISEDKFIDVMSTLGCKGVLETNPEATDIFKEKGVTLAEVQNFRKKMDPKNASDIANQVANRVMECHGVSTQ